MVPNKRRLMDLIVSLAQSPHPERFNMKQFVYARPEDGWCGSPACVLGHYGCRPDLQDILRVNKDSDGMPFLGYTAQEERHRNEIVCIDDEQIRNWFDIDLDQCLELFDINGCAGAQTPEAAISYIAHFIMENCE